MDDSRDFPNSDVAVVAFTGRFPGAADPQELWKNLRSGTESLSRFTEAELQQAGVPAELSRHPNYVPVRGTIDAIDLFDAQFFAMTPREAAEVDPQQRIFLEECWHALELAGYGGSDRPDSIAVFGGASANTYFLSQFRRDDQESLQVAIAGAPDFLATRVGYKLNLRGPCLTVQTACSTSLVAVHLACQSLLNGETDLALAGGISITVPNRIGYTYEPEGILSPDGRCRPFGAGANGTVPGNGVAVVVLKRLADAVRDRDVIHAVVKGSAINNDGSGKVGFTAPSVAGQAAVISEAIRVAGLDPSQISYVEAHGTGTLLGDPIEIQALREVFSVERHSPCFLGSVKSNLGHLDAAAGVAGLIKVVLALKNREIPPTLNFDVPNPEAHLEESPFRVNSTLVSFEPGCNGEPLRAGVSSFGIGGTNAHVVLEEAPLPAVSGPAREVQIVSLSAKTRPALQKQINQLASFLETHPQACLAEVSYTLHLGRSAFPYRMAFAAADRNEALSLLKTPGHPATHAGHTEQVEPQVVFMFPGQGSQFVNMGRDLYRSEPVFRDTMDQCAALLEPHLGLDVRRVLYADSSDRQDSELTQTLLAQPCLFATEFSLAMLCMDWGIRPQAMTGHSIGEYVAACLAGVMTLESALKLVAVRGRMMQALPPGSMIAVPLSADQVEKYLGDGVSLAASNSSLLSVLAGPEERISALAATLTQDHVTHTRLHTSHAFHSEMMDPIVDNFIRAVSAERLSVPQIRYISNLTGTWIRPEEAVSPEYYGRHLRNQVRFTEGLEELLKDSTAVFLEVGPGNTLTNFVKYHASKGTQAAVPMMRYPQAVRSHSAPPSGATASDVPFLLDALAAVWANGGYVGWPDFYRHQARSRVELPPYPFERQKYWQAAVSEKQSIVTAQGPRQFNTYYQSWKAESAFVRDVTSALKEESWLVFLDESGIGKEIAHRLLDAGQKVFTIAERVADASTADMELMSRSRQDYDSMWQELKARRFSPDRILYFSCLSENPSTSEEAYKPFFSLLHLAQSLAHFEKAVQLQVISNGLQAITGCEALQPSNSLLLGPGRVLTQELSNANCSMVDVDLDELRSSSRLMEALFQECLTGSRQDLVCYRGLRRWVPTLEDLPAESAAGGSRLRDQGAYVILGDESPGTENLIAWLNARCQARVVLVKDHPAAGGLGGRSALQELESAFQENASATPRNTSVFAVLDDPAQLSRVIELVQGRWGAVHGIFHTASISSGGLIQTKSYAQAKNVLRAKVSTLLALEQAIRGRQLDFIIFFSSTSAITGGIGQVDACAGNAYVQAFAARLWFSGNVPAIAILWDPFEWETWPGANLQAASGVQEQIKKTLEAFGITRKQMEAALDLALAVKAPELIVSRRNLPAVLSEYRALKLANVMQSLGTETVSHIRHPRPELQTAYVAPRNETEKSIAEVWEELFGFEQIGVHDKFFDLGGNSLLAIQLAGKMRNLLQQDFSMDLIFTRQTIGELSEHLALSPSLSPDEMAEVERLMAEMANLSPEERRALLSDADLREGDTHV